MESVKKYTITLLLACSMATPASAQTIPTLKSVMESHFTGTTLRDITLEFGLTKDGNGYALTGRIHQLNSPTRIRQFLEPWGSWMPPIPPNAIPEGSILTGTRIAHLSISNPPMATYSMHCLQC